MTPEISSGLILLAASGVVGWGVTIQEKVTRHEAVIEKLDQLLTLLLEDRLAKDQTGSVPEDTGNRSRRRERLRGDGV